MARTEIWNRSWWTGEGIEEKKRLKRNLCRLWMKPLHKFYREQFYRTKKLRNTPIQMEQKYCDEIEIGYAPANGKGLRAFPIKKSWWLNWAWSIKWLWFLSEPYYTHTFRFQKIIGFTARSLDDTQPKYLNSKSLFFTANDALLFGLDVAWREPAKIKVVSCGRCARLYENASPRYGKYSCISWLAWTDEQFQLIHELPIKFVSSRWRPPKDGKIIR